MSYNPRHVKLNNGGLQGLINAAELAARNAQSQRTNNSGTHFIPSGEIGEDGIPKGTLIGPGAQNGGVAPWVNDTTPPGKPLGLSVSSSASMVYITWDGAIEGGMPPDFDHLQIYVDGVETAQLVAQGVAVAGPYENDSKHKVYAIAWDNAHDGNGIPKPNGSARSETLDIVVSSAEIDPSQFGGTITESENDPQGDGAHKGDLWIKYGVSGSRKVRSEEWWWDGTAWQPLPMAIYLDQLAARDVKIDSAVIGMLSAGIIQSGTFVTPDGLVGFDSNGFWAKDKDGNYLFKASGTGVQSVGGFVTAASGDRIQLSQTLIQNTNTGGLQGIGDDPNHPYWLIWGSHNADNGSSLFIGTTPQQPEIAMNSSQSTRDLSLTSQTIHIGSALGTYFMGPVVDNGISRTLKSPRLAYEWHTDWTGIPSDGAWTEKKENFTVNSGTAGGDGKWYILDIGARVSGQGEYEVKFRLSINGSVKYQYALLAPAKGNGGSDNYTLHKTLFIENGTYELYIETDHWGSVSIDNNSSYSFIDKTIDPSGNPFARFLTLTEV